MFLFKMADLKKRGTVWRRFLFYFYNEEIKKYRKTNSGRKMFCFLVK